MSMFLSDSGFYNVLNAMTRTKVAQATTMARLASSKRINSAADDPAGLIAISLLGSELTGVQAASENISRANAVLNTADAAAGEISSLVTDIQTAAASLANDTGLSADEKAALQLSIDSAISSIDRLVNSTSFNGQRLLDGTYGIDTSGVDAAAITDVDITGRPARAGTFNVQVEVASAAEKGQLTFTGTGLSAAQNISLEITGNLGAVELSFTGSASIGDMASTINAATGSTGVTAVASGGALYLQSEHYGEDEFVKVETIAGSFTMDGSDTYDAGADAVVTVNGQTAAVNGLNVSFNVGSISGTLTLHEDLARTKGGGEGFTVTGGGATFAVSPNLADLANIGISDLGSTHLGNGTLGYLNSIKTGGANCASDNPGLAMRIASAAATQVARTRANIGGFQTYTLGSMSNALAKAETSLAGSISQIEDADYAVEVANMSRLNTLFQAQVSALALMSNQASSISTLFNSIL